MGTACTAFHLCADTPCGAAQQRCLLRRLRIVSLVWHGARNNFTESTNFRAPVQHNHTHNRCKTLLPHLANALGMAVCEGLLPRVRIAGSECAHARTVSAALNCTFCARHPDFREELCGGTWRFSSRFWRPRNGARTVRCASRSSRQVRFSQTFGESHTVVTMAQHCTANGTRCNRAAQR